MSIDFIDFFCYNNNQK